MYPRMHAYFKSSICAQQTNNKLLRLTWSDKWSWNTWESSSAFFSEMKKSLTFLRFNECQLFIITCRTTKTAAKCRNLCQTNYCFAFILQHLQQIKIWNVLSVAIQLCWFNLWVFFYLKFTFCFCTSNFRVFTFLWFLFR